jgi:uncharacterized secreted repeat protein (TIGR03808 family)
MTHPTRRYILAGLAALSATPALAETSLDATSFGISPGSLDDQTAALQSALDAAHADGRTLVLPAGEIFVKDLNFPAKIRVTGTPGATNLMLHGSGTSIGRAYLAMDLELDGIGFSGGVAGQPASGNGGLLEIDGSFSVRIVNCTFLFGAANGLSITNSSATIEDCDFADFAEAAIFSQDSAGLMIRGNRIRTCGNGGILVWRSEKGHDGSIITGNQIEAIDWKGGGNGQNGNGINLFRAGDVVVSDNVITGCAFSAIRLNATDNCQVTGNLCRTSGEVAIFSEFEFTASVIANNIIDGAAQGISITNMLEGGTLAVCTGNIVRNITASSAVNPDTRGVGIYAEAETAITGNSVSAVDGIGIGVGFGPYRRNVVVNGNTVSAVTYGIAVSVVDEPPSGPVSITGNQISGASAGAMVGMRWDEMVERDLAANAANYPHVQVANNQVTYLDDRD